MNRIEILDCTLRDGGYYTNWDFDQDFVNRYLEALAALGVSLVEIGFFSKVAPDYRGSHYYSRSHLIDRLSIPSSIKLGVMINASEFQSFNTDEQIESFLAKLDTRLTFVRLACHHHELEMMNRVISVLDHMGLDVGLNLMKMEGATDTILDELVSLGIRHKVKWLYLADSFGSCTPAFVTSMFKRLREIGWSGIMGFHSHDNCGLAMANVFGAIEGGAQVIDATILGMGRGPGNVKTEQLISARRLADNSEDISPGDFLSLYELIEDYFSPLQKKQKWGSSIPYAISALKRIHPSFGQEMVRQNYSPASLISSLIRIGEGGSVYSQRVLEQFADYEANSMTTETEDLSAIRGRLVGNQVIIVGGGRSNCSLEQIEALKAGGAFVIGLNVPSGLAPEICDLFAVSQPVRVDQVIEFATNNCRRPILMPERIVANAAGLHFFTYGLTTSKDLAIDAHSCTIPYALVVGYALSFALSVEPSDIVLVGVSGYGLDQEEHHRTQILLTALHRAASERSVRVRTAGSNSFDLPEINLDVLEENS